MHPEPGCSIGQGFAQNFNPSYKDGGLIGHTGWDEKCGYGTPIRALADGIVYSTFPIAHPANDGYTAIFTLCRTPLEDFELSYGHVSEIDVQIGQAVKRGDIIGKEGNHGIVYSGNHLVTLAEQAAGSHEGSHRHYQKRVVLRKKFAHSPFLQTANGPYFDSEGYYYEYAMPNNGFKSCVDFEAPLFDDDLEYGQTGYYVLLLQRALVLEGFASFEPTGYFGQKTYLALQTYQRAHGINPIGRCGPATRTSLNEKYKQLV